MNKKGDSTSIHREMESASEINFQHQVLHLCLSILCEDRTTNNLSEPLL